MKFATAINCVDGRIQIPVMEWIKEQFDVDYVDMITEAAVVKILSEETDNPIHTSIKSNVEISVSKHQSKLVAVVAHHDCAANSVTKENQLGQMKSAIENVKKWNFNVQLIGLWVDENFEVTEIHP